MSYKVLECPSCGAKVKSQGGGKGFSCPDCGCKMLFEKTINTLEDHLKRDRDKDE